MPPMVTKVREAEAFEAWSIVVALPTLAPIRVAGARRPFRHQRRAETPIRAGYGTGRPRTAIGHDQVVWSSWRPPGYLETLHTSPVEFLAPTGVHLETLHRLAFARPPFISPCGHAHRHRAFDACDPVAGEIKRRDTECKPTPVARRSVVFGGEVLGCPHRCLGAIGDVDALEQATAV